MTRENPPKKKGAVKKKGEGSNSRSKKNPQSLLLIRGVGTQKDRAVVQGKLSMGEKKIANKKEKTIIKKTKNHGGKGATQKWLG